jgi:hypothetical protein
VRPFLLEGEPQVDAGRVRVAQRPLAKVGKGEASPERDRGVLRRDETLVLLEGEIELALRAQRLRVGLPRLDVARVAWIQPRKPFFTSVGRFPEWSMCACERMTASIERASTGSSRFRARVSWRFPW